MKSFSKAGAGKTENQDFCYFLSAGNYDFAAVADGVSMCSLSREGAEFVCKKTAAALIEEADYIFSLSEDKAAALIVKYIQAQIEKMAVKKNTDPKEYSSTLSFVCRHKGLGKIFTFNLGDSCCYLIMNNESEIKRLDTSKSYCPIPVSSMTKGAEKEAVVSFFDETEFDCVFLCTDGFWRIMESGGKNKSRLKAALREQDISFLTEYIEKNGNDDDCSFLLYNLKYSLKQ